MSNEKIHQEHDKGYRHLLQSKRAFMDLLKSFVKTDWVELIREEDLVRIDKSFVLQDFSGKEADIVYRSSIKGQDIIFYVLLELQSTVDHQMPWRLLLYMTEIWRGILKDTPTAEIESKDFRIPAIVPLVLYNGKASWTAVKSFREYQKGHELFGDILLDFKYSLLNVNEYTEQDLLELATLMSAVFYLDQDIGKEELRRRIKVLIKYIQKLKIEEQRLLFGWMNNIIDRRLDEKTVKELLETSEGVVNLVYAIEKILESERIEGKLEGKLEGIREGELKGKLEGIQVVARNLLRIDTDVDTIVSVTGLSKEEIEKLREEQH